MDVETVASSVEPQQASNLKRQMLVEAMGGTVIMLREGLDLAGVVKPDPQTPEDIQAMWPLHERAVMTCAVRPDITDAALSEVDCS
jgi:hypothetical protein